MRHPAQLPNVNHFLTTLHEGTGRHTYSPVLFKSHVFHFAVEPRVGSGNRLCSSLCSNPEVTSHVIILCRCGILRAGQSVLRTGKCASAALAVK